jgi:N6-adenosine-specific RNA methylase IME4
MYVRYFNQINWIKVTKNNVLVSGNGHYLQHQKEMCLIGIKVCFNYIIEFLFLSCYLHVMLG